MDKKKKLMIKIKNIKFVSTTLHSSTMLNHISQINENEELRSKLKMP